MATPEPLPPAMFAQVLKSVNPQLGEVQPNGFAPFPGIVFASPGAVQAVSPGAVQTGGIVMASPVPLLIGSAVPATVVASPSPVVLS